MLKCPQKKFCFEQFKEGNESDQMFTRGCSTEPEQLLESILTILNPKPLDDLFHQVNI